MKKDTKCDVFISIHQNMFPQSKCYGAQVWYASNENSYNLATVVQESIKESVKDYDMYNYGKFIPFERAVNILNRFHKKALGLV